MTKKDSKESQNSQEQQPVDDKKPVKRPPVGKTFARRGVEVQK